MPLGAAVAVTGMHWALQLQVDDAISRGKSNAGRPVSLFCGGSSREPVVGDARACGQSDASIELPMVTRR